MSSILKALKKVEGDASQTVGADSSQINARGAVSRRARRGLLFRRVLLVLILVICVLAGWWAFARYKPVLAKWFSKPQPEVQATKKDSTAQSDQKMGAMRAAALTNRAARQRAVSAPGEKTPDQPVQRQEAQPNRPTVPAEPLAPRGVDPAGTGGPQQPGSPQQKIPPAPSARSALPAQPEARVSRDPAVTPPTPRITRPAARSMQTTPATQEGEPELEVQAIAWSKDPAKRIAVVNGKVVREGGSLDGFSVTEIGLDDVTFKKGGVERRLRCIGSHGSAGSQ